MKLISKILLSIMLMSWSFGLHADQTMTRGEAFIYFANQHKSQTPDSYQYIDLHYKAIPVDSQLEDALQILVYQDLIQNVSINIGADQLLGEKDFDTLKELLSPKTTIKDAPTITISSGLADSSKSDLGDKEKIFYDVYNTLSNSHYDHSEFEEDQLTQGAIKGIAESTGDKYTSYFPPVESNTFFESLDGEFEGIGSYVEMNNPGELTIVSPIVGSPSEAAGVLPGDRVTHVDDKEITQENSLQEVVSWIKGPSGTRVKLTILREGESESVEIYVTRAKITIKDVEHKKLDNRTYYIQIKNFGENVDTDFKAALEAVLENRSIDKIVFDLRNNPGGYLGEVSNMLSYFVEKGEPTAIVDSGAREIKYSSHGFDLIDFNDYELIFLQNGGSASASEIMIGTVKDYYPDSTIIGTQSFGKGSVQTLKSYADGSTLKYTTAKWFTGKTKQGIDGIGITPDLELEFDSERWKTYKKDNQLEKAINY